jgi:hypothetical protein
MQLQIQTLMHMNAMYVRFYIAPLLGQRTMRRVTTLGLRQNFQCN